MITFAVLALTLLSLAVALATIVDVAMRARLQLVRLGYARTVEDSPPRPVIRAGRSRRTVRAQGRGAIGWRAAA